MCSDNNDTIVNCRRTIDPDDLEFAVPVQSTQIQELRTMEFCPQECGNSETLISLRNDLDDQSAVIYQQAVIISEITKLEHGAWALPSISEPKAIAGSACPSI